MQRLPLVERMDNIGDEEATPYYSGINKSDLGSFTPRTSKKLDIQFDSVERNAQAVLDALAEESPEKHKDFLFAALEAAASPVSERPRRRSGGETDFMDVITASEPGSGDAELNAAIDALETVQQFAANRAAATTVTEQSDNAAITPGQRLALFLKEQLLHREAARRRAEQQATTATEALAAKDAQLATAQMQCEAYKQQSLQSATQTKSLQARVSQMESKLSVAESSVRDSKEALRRKEAEIKAVRREAAAKVETTQQRMADMEVKLHLSYGGYGEKKKNSPVRKSAAAAVDNDDEEEEEEGGQQPFASQDFVDDVFASPALPCFHRRNHNHDDSVSVADSDDVMISEAAAAVRQVARSTALQVMQQEEERTGAAAAAAADGNSEKRQLQVLQREQATEERLLRSEIDTLQRKCERADHMLLKANHALRVLHHKLQRERQSVAALQEEKCLLQSQVIAAADRPQGLDPQQLGALLQELAQCRVRVETLAEERATLTARLHAAEDQLNSADEEHIETRAAAEREAKERLEEARARGEALETRVEQLVEQLTTAAAAASQLELTSAALQEAQTRCGQLAAELESERMLATDRATEVSNLAEVAQAFAAELMAAREEAHSHRAAFDHAAHENAGLQGRVEALTDALSRLERADNVLESMAEDHAELQGRLRQAEASATGARAAAEAARADLQSQSEYGAELERTLEVLKSELAAAEEHNHALESAATAVAEQLRQLSQSHEALQFELETAAGDVGVARRDAAELAQRVMAAESRAEEAERHAAAVHSTLEATEAREGALSGDLQDMTAVAHEAATEAERLRAAVAVVEQERDEACGRVDRLEATVAAMTAESEALRRSRSDAEGTSQVLVDNMCDMTGLIDAVTALQTQKRLLEEECDAVAVRARRAEAERDATALECAAVQRELGHEKERAVATQTANEILQHGHDALRGDYAVATRQLEAIEHAHDTLRHENAALQQRELEVRAAAAAASAEGDRLRTEVDRLSSALAEAHSHATTSQSELRGMFAQKEEWMRCEQELREQVAATEKARGLAEGKLILARQREVKFKEAAVQLRQLQADLEIYLLESEALRQQKDAAEGQCAELTGRCMVLLDQLNSLEEQIAEAGSTVVVHVAQQEAVQEELRATQAFAEGLQDQLLELSPLPTRVAELEAEQQETADWCDAMSVQLSVKQDELAAAVEELDALREECDSLELDLASTRERAAAAEGAAARAEAGRMTAATDLTAAAQGLETLSQELETKTAHHQEALELLRVVESERDTAKERAASAEHILEQLRSEHSTLETTLSSALAAHSAVEEALHRRLSELEASSSESAGQAAALDEARRHQIEELQMAVHAGSAACANLASKVESATKGRQHALEECAELQLEAEELQAELAAVQTQLATAQSALVEAAATREELVASSASHARAAELLEVQCTALRGQVEFLQSTQMKHADDTDGVRQQLEVAYESVHALREQLVLAEQALHRSVQDAEVAQAAAAAAHQEVAQSALSATEAQRAADAAAFESRAAHAARSEAERRVASLEQQLELSEVLKEQGQREAEMAREVAAEARSQAQHAQEAASEADRRRLTALSESELVVRDARARMASQMAVMEKIEAALAGVLVVEESDDDSAPSAVLSSVAAHLQSIVTSHATITETTHTNTAGGGGGGEPLLETQRAALLQKLSDVQQGVARLAGDRAAQEQAAAIAEATENERAATWHAEKSIMRAVCRLALAVTTDQVQQQDTRAPSEPAAPAMVAELDHVVTTHAETLKELKLDGVWASLRHLAKNSVGAASRRAAAEGDLNRLSSEVSALRSRCEDLEMEVHEEKTRADAVECVLHSEADRLRSLASSVRWATGDPPSSSAASLCSSQIDETSAEQLAQCVDALTTAVQRLVRRYRTLSRHVATVEEERYCEDVENVKQAPDARSPAVFKSSSSSIRGRRSGGGGTIPAYLGDGSGGSDERDVPLRARFGSPVL